MFPYKTLFFWFDFPVFQDSAFASGVMEKLGKPGHYTLFVPTNEAFNKLSEGFMERNTENQAVITGT